MIRLSQGFSVRSVDALVKLECSVKIQKNLHPRRRKKRGRGALRRRATTVHRRASVRTDPNRPDAGIGKPPYSSHRSWTMAQIRSKHTTPEMAVRKAAHALGLRFRLHSSDLPGRPDLVFRRWRTALFVNGCFWHSHHCERARLPKTNVDYWTKKLRRNTLRDKETARLLRKGRMAVRSDMGVPSQRYREIGQDPSPPVRF